MIQVDVYDNASGSEKLIETTFYAKLEWALDEAKRKVAAGYAVHIKKAD